MPSNSISDMSDAFQELFSDMELEGMHGHYFGLASGSIGGHESCRKQGIYDCNVMLMYYTLQIIILYNYLVVKLTTSFICQ